MSEAEYIYVMAEVSGERLEEDGPGAISFGSCRVRAHSDREAYSLGQEIFKEQWDASTGIINDYVVNLEEI